MQNVVSAIRDYVTDTRHLHTLPSSTENTFYPAIKTLIAVILKEGRLPFQVRVNTSESSATARDMPDFILGDDKLFVGVFGEPARGALVTADGPQGRYPRAMAFRTCNIR